MQRLTAHAKKRLAERFGFTGQDAVDIGNNLFNKRAYKRIASNFDRGRQEIRKVKHKGVIVRELSRTVLSLLSYMEDLKIEQTS